MGEPVQTMQVYVAFNVVIFSSVLYIAVTTLLVLCYAPPPKSGGHYAKLVSVRLSVLQTGAL